MKVNLAKGAFGIFLGLFATAVPGYCSAFLAFSTSSGGGSVIVNGNSQNSSETLASISALTFNLLTISNAPTAADNGTWNLTSTSLSWAGDQIVLSGTIGTCHDVTGGCSGGGTNLNGVSILESTSSYYLPYNSTAGSSGTVAGFNTNAGSTSINVGWGAATSLGTNSTFLTDLGFTANASNYLTTSGGGGFTAAGNGVVNNGQYTYGSNFSETFNVTITAAPEPVSFFLLGGGLLGIGLIARKRSAQS